MQAVFNQNSVPNWLNLSSPETIVVSIVKRFRDRKSPFEERINVEDWVPDYYTDENKARFVFFTTAVDYGMRSPVLYRGMVKLLQDNPAFLSNEFLESAPKEKLAILLKNYLHLRWPNNAARYFINNARILRDTYNKGVLNIFKAATGREVIKRLKIFYGFGKKTTYLCFRATVNTFSLDYPDIDTLAMPIDRHKLKFTYLLGYITKRDFLEKKLEKVSKIWINACKNVNISWLEFDRAFWIFTRWFNTLIP